MRILVRIWLHGIRLFVGVVATIVIARAVLSRHDAGMAARSHPVFTLGLAERALAVRDHDLAREVGRLHDESSIELTVLTPGGVVLAASSDPAPPATPEELRSLSPSRYIVDGQRFVVGAFTERGLAAYAIAVMPTTPTPIVHLIGILAAALILGFLVVSLPLTRWIVRPIENLRALSKQLGEGNLAVRANTDRRDEIGDLARSFNTMAEQVQQLRAAERELLADVSHELRTPLARIRVVLELATSGDPRYLREITTDVSELEQLLDDIIASSRLDAQSTWSAAKPPLRRRSLGVDELVDASALRFTERWPDRVLSRDGRATELTVDGDPVLLRRALDNLVDNARKYSERPIAMTVVRTDLRGRPAVKIEVVDEGIGIAEEDHPRVFTAFYRADKSRTRTTGGVGLGLALARRIVEAHDGEIGFTSAFAVGSRFWFVLPVVQG